MCVWLHSLDWLTGCVGFFTAAPVIAFPLCSSGSDLERSHDSGQNLPESSEARSPRTHPELTPGGLQGTPEEWRIEAFYLLCAAALTTASGPPEPGEVEG